MNITLNQIEQHNPCSDRWVKLLKSLGKTKADDEPLSLMHILKSNGIKDAIWTLRCLECKDYCLLNANIAESVLYIFEDKYPTDNRPRKAIEAIRLYHKGEITKGELEAAADDARAAAYDAYDATAARAVAYAAYGTAYGTDDAATAVAYAAYADDAAAAYYSTYAAAHAAAYADYTKWKEIEQLFIKHFGEKE